MPDIGWMELLVIGIVALIVVGPKELPMMFRKAGQFTGRVRAMARDFQRAMDDAAEESGMSDINRDLRKASNFTANPAKSAMNSLKETLGDDLNLEPEKYDAGSQTRKMAEDRAASAKQTREAAAARRQALIDKTIAEAEGAGTPAAVEAPADTGAPRP